jgi:D-3-phosphoglycerate dehydrogenase
VRILVVGDSYYRSEAFRSGFGTLEAEHLIEYLDVEADEAFAPRDESERRLLEYEGNPDVLAGALSDHDVLVVHGAPVSQAVLTASPNLQLVCCARGGPVNVDVESATRLGITIATTPGKNAPAVADLTIALAVMLVRAIGPAQAYLRNGGRVLSAFEGSRFFGSELEGLSLGVIGFGRVGSEVGTRARSMGMRVGAFDPFVEPQVMVAAGVDSMELEELVQRADIVSLHTRHTPDSQGMVGAKLLSRFKPGSFLINTAREAIVDEHAVLASLRSGHLRGVAVDVFETNGPIDEAIRTGEDRLIALPHIGGATYQTLRRGADLIAQHITAFAADRRLI